MKSRGLPCSDDAAGRAGWARRVILGGLGTAGATVALAAFAASAFANAANPTAASSTETINGDGTVTVTVSGTWSWGELNGVQTSPQKDCTGRSGVGWSVDWWGMTNTVAPDPTKGPIKGTLVNPTTSSASAPQLVQNQNLSVGGTWQVKSGASAGQYFHTSSLYNGFLADLCKAPAVPAPDGPTGPYTATATYPNIAAVPAKICVNFYDPHGSEGKYSTSTSDNFATKDGDNSIAKNNFDPLSVQGNCSVPVLQNPTMTVDKMNNAGGSYQDTGQASSLGQDVTFRAIITNTSTVPLTIDTVKDAIPDGTPNPGSVACLTAGNPGHNVVGDILQPKGQAGDSETCFFTIPNYLAANGIDVDGSLIDDVIVTAHNGNVPTQADDTSTVLAPAGTPNLDAVKFGPSTGVASQTGDYRVKLINSGNKNAAGPITFYDQLPVGETFSKVVGGPSAPFTDSGMSCTAGPVNANGQLVTCKYNHDLAKGASANVWIEVTYAAGTEGKTLTDCVGLDPTKAVPGAARADQCVDTKILEPKLKITKTGPDTGVPGGNGTYTITVTNTGAGPATTVSFVDKLPAKETFVSASGDFKCTEDPNDATKINCEIKSAKLPLAAGDSVTVDVLVQYALTSVQGDQLEDCAILPNLDKACKTTTINTPDLVIKKTGPATGVAGDQGKYTIVVTNNGQADATNVSFKDVLPDGETFSSASTGVFTCTKTADPQIINCTLNAGTLPKGASASVDVTVTYALDSGGKTLTDCAVLAPGNQSCVPTKIPSTPSISVVKTNDANGDGVFHDSEQAGNQGDPVKFKVVITNTSGDPIALDSISDAYASIANLAECPNLIGTVLDAGDSVTCVFTVDNYAPAAGDSLVDTVTVGGHQVPGGTPVTGTDTSTVTTKKPKTPGPDLAIVKTADQAKVKAGDTLTYTLSVSNVGDGPTTGLVGVFDTVPSGLDLVSVDGGSAWDCSVSGRDITCTYNGGVVNPGDVLPDITVVTRVNSTATVRVVNTGVVSTPGDTNPLNDRSTVKTPVTQVLGEKVTNPKTPTVLPFTGDRTGQLLPAGLLAVILGLALMVTGRRRRRTA